MRIINTADSQQRHKNTRVQSSRHGILCFKSVVFSFAALFLITGCVQKAGSGSAKDYIEQSDSYYQRAVAEYNSSIARGKNTDRLYFELGELYFRHGEYALAQEALKRSADPQASKILAISHYRLGNLTDALEIFNRQESTDEEYLFYQGLTCEKLNLFDQALKAYAKVKDKKFGPQARARIEAIERGEKSLNIGEIDPAIAGIISASGSQEEFPQAGALILLCDEKVEVTEQNTQVSTLHYLVKILNARGKEDFSEMEIEYDSTYEKVELEYARTIRPDKAVVNVGSRHIRDVSKYMNFPLYSNARVCIISFPEVAEGSVIEYRLKIYRSQLINKKDTVIAYPVQSSEPIASASFQMILPLTRQLHLETVNASYNGFGATLEPAVEEKDGKRIYGWRFKNIPQIIPEFDMPPHVYINPSILMSTFGNWQEIYDWWWPLAKDKISADSGIKEKVAQLIKDKISDEDKARSIYNFCAREIRYVAVEYGQAGYEPHQASMIFKNKYGDCKDQAVLLVTMLKEAGLNAWPVLIPTKEVYNLNRDFPMMMFNHAIACVSIGGKIIYLDPTAETCPFGDLPSDDQARRVIIIKESDFQIADTPLYPAAHNLMRQEVKLKVNRDESISVQKTLSALGVYEQAQRYWLLYTQPDLIRETLQQRAQEVSIGARLTGYKIDNLEEMDKPVALSYGFQGPEYFTIAGHLRIMPQLANVDTSVAAKEKRSYPLDFGIPDVKETAFEIDLPDGYRVKYLPQDVILDSPWMRFSAEYNHSVGKIFFRQKTELKKNTVTQKEYADFKRFIEGLAKKIKERVVLEKGS